MRVKTISKVQNGRRSSSSDERGVAFDDDAFEGREKVGDDRNVCWRDRARIKEASGVVELDPPRGWEVSERGTDLPGDGAKRDGLVERVRPKIAEDALPRAFAIGEEKRDDRKDAAEVIGLLFYELTVGAMRIK